MGRQMQGFVKKIAIFGQYFTLFRKWYKTEPWLLWNTNTGNSTQAFERYHFQWPWTTPNPDVKVALFIWRWLSQKRYEIQWNTNRDLHTPYSAVSLISNDLEWPRLAANYSTTRSIARSLCNSGATYLRKTVKDAWSVITDGQRCT